MASVDKFTAMHGFQVWLVISLRTPKCLQQFPGYVLDRKGGHSESERLQTETRCADMWGKWALWSKIYIAHYSLNSRGYIYIYNLTIFPRDIGHSSAFRFHFEWISMSPQWIFAWPLCGVAMGDSAACQMMHYWGGIGTAMSTCFMAVTGWQ